MELFVKEFTANNYCDISICEENITRKTTVTAEHGFFEIAVPLSSGFRAVCNEKKTVCNIGEAFLFTCTDEYSFMPGSGKIIRFCFSSEIAADIKRILKNEQVFRRRSAPVSKGDISVLEALAKQTTDEILLKRTLFNLICDRIIPNQTQPDKKNLIPVWLSDTVNEMKINKNYTKGVPKMVELSGKTAEHLSRSMKKYYNVSPTDYINNLRMKNVSRLLLETDNPVIDICYENGYQNMSWFNTLFKKTFFMTPSQFREKFKNNVK